MTHSLTVSRADAQAKGLGCCMTDLALVVLLRRAVLVAELPDVSVLASDAHMQGLDVLPLLLQLSLCGSGHAEDQQSL